MQDSVAMATHMVAMATGSLVLPGTLFIYLEYSLTTIPRFPGLEIIY